MQVPLPPELSRQVEHFQRHGELRGAISRPVDGFVAREIEALAEAEQRLARRLEETARARSPQGYVVEAGSRSGTTGGSRNFVTVHYEVSGQPGEVVHDRVHILAALENPTRPGLDFFQIEGDQPDWLDKAQYHIKAWHLSEAGQSLVCDARTEDDLMSWRALWPAGVEPAAGATALGLLQGQVVVGGVRLKRRPQPSE